MGTFQNISSIFSDIGNALRSKMGVADTFTPNNMAPAINNMSTIEIIESPVIEPSSSEEVIGYTVSAAPIPNNTIFTPYGNINVVYDYSMKTYNIGQIINFSGNNCRWMFGENSNNVMDFDLIKFGNNAQLLDYVFYNCQAFNEPVITNNAQTLTYAFYNCYAFNQPITIPNSVRSMRYTFYECHAFNQPITIPNNVYALDYIFFNCYAFNQPITIPLNSNITNTRYTFYGCHVFNQPITIPNSVNNMQNTFCDCHAFNQPIIIPNKVTTIQSAFNGCHAFNQPITIPNSVTNMEDTFRNCYAFNQPITIPNSVINMSYAFYNCYAFNQPITIPQSVNRIPYAFSFCSNFGSSIYFRNSSKIVSAGGLFANCNNSLKKSIYCKNAVPFINSNKWESIVGVSASVTWDTLPDGNGYYNTAFNIYIYNNWTPT